MRLLPVAVPMILLAGAALAPQRIPAQAATALTGTVVDSRGRPVRDVVVEVKPLERRAVTDSLGRFNLAPVPAGRYRLSAQTIGYAATTASINVPGDEPPVLRLRNSDRKLRAMAEEPRSWSRTWTSYRLERPLVFARSALLREPDTTVAAFLASRVSAPHGWRVVVNGVADPSTSWLRRFRTWDLVRLEVSRPAADEPTTVLLFGANYAVKLASLRTIGLNPGFGVPLPGPWPADPSSAAAPGNLSQRCNGVVWCGSASEPRVIFP